MLHKAQPRERPVGQGYVKPDGLSRRTGQMHGRAHNSKKTGPSKISYMSWSTRRSSKFNADTLHRDSTISAKSVKRAVIIKGHFALGYPGRASGFNGIDCSDRQPASQVPRRLHLFSSPRAPGRHGLFRMDQCAINGSAGPSHPLSADDSHRRPPTNGDLRPLATVLGP